MKLQLSEHLSLPPDAVTQTFGVLAVRGAGKSNTAAVMAEEMFRAGLPFAVVDPVGAWWGLRSSRDGGPGISVPIFGGRHGDVPLEKAGGTLIADLLVDERLSCVIDVSDFSESDKIRFLTEFAERLYRRNQDPLHLFLEEADDYVPQRPFREQARCLRAFENIVRRGRARGLGITMISQRSAAINKNVLTQIETLFVLRTTSPQDRKAIEAWVEYHGQAKELVASLPSLVDGEAWVWSPHWLQILDRFRIRRRETFDSGATPKDLKGRRPPATLADVDLGAIQQRMAATIERAKAEDPRELRKEIARLNSELRNAKSELAAKQAMPERVEVPVLDGKELERLKEAVGQIEELADEATGALVGSIDKLRAELMEKWPGTVDRAFERVTKPLDDISERLSRLNGRKHVEKGEAVAGRDVPRDRCHDRGPSRHKDLPRSSDAFGESLTGPERRILEGLARLRAIGIASPPRAQVALLARYKSTASTGFPKGLSSLHVKEFVSYPSGGRVALTDAGLDAVGNIDHPVTTEELHEMVRDVLAGVEWRVLEPLIGRRGEAVDRATLAHEAGYQSIASTGFPKAVSRLSSLGLVDYPSPGMVRATSMLFLEDS